MRRTVVLDVVGLSPHLVGEATPSLAALAREGAVRPLATVTPAVTCPVQSTFVTGLAPRDHGIVANGWYFRDLSEVWLWRQSNRLVAGEKLWETARRIDPGFTCAVLFWWYNMYSSADFTVTPRPMYPADGRKLPDIYTQPAALRPELTARLGLAVVTPPEHPRDGVTLTASTNSDNAPTGNPLRSIWVLEVEPRLSNLTKFQGASEDHWLLLGGPASAPLYVGFLDGRETPVVEQFDQNPEFLGRQYRVYHDFGSALGEHRSGVYSTGEGGSD
jgi:predicted AlkP superfamily pyrophosphatase or phosphodiesterase